MGHVAVLSASQVDTFRSCSLKWHLRYREQAPPESRGAALVVGSVVDVAIKTGIHDLRSGEASIENLEALPLFREAWDAELASSDVPIAWGKKGQDACRSVAERLVKTYFDAEDLEERVARIEALDVRFELPVIDPNAGIELPDLRIVGYLDALERNDAGELRALDWKTAASRSGYDETSLATHLQGTLYAWAMKQIHGDEASDEVAFHVGLKLEAAIWEDRLVTLGEGAQRRALLTVIHAHRGMQVGTAFPSPNLYCGSCSYLKRCRSWQDSEAARLPVDPFAAEVLSA